MTIDRPIVYVFALIMAVMVIGAAVDALLPTSPRMSAEDFRK